jgi:anti-sigma B factor antagonist
MPPSVKTPVDGTRIPPRLRVTGTSDHPQFWLTTTREFAHLTFWLHGELDLAFSEQLVSAVCAQLAIGGMSGVTFDLSGLDFLSVSGISALIAVQQLARQRGVPFALRHVPTRVQRLFRICDVTRFRTRSPGPSFASRDEPPTVA